MSVQKRSRAQLIRDLLAESLSMKAITDKVIESLDDDERILMLRTSVMKEVAREQGAATSIASGLYPNRGHHVSEDASSSREEFLSVATKFFINDDDPGDRLSRRADLLLATFTVPDTGEIVRWGDATEAQHLSHKARCEKIAYKVANTANLHTRAISEIRAAKVRTLNEIVELRHSNVKAIEAA